MDDVQPLQGLSLWRALCHAFFETPGEEAVARAWPRPVLQGVMDAALKAQVGEDPGPLAPDGDVAAADLEAGDADETTATINHLLWALGVRKAAGATWCLTPSLRSEMESIKNQVRGESHRLKTRARIEMYHSACRDFAATAQGRAPGSGGEPESAKEAADRLAIVQAFSQRWRADQATHSFINGLIRALKAQRDSPQHCVRWMVGDVVFVEHPDVAAFTRSSLELLTSALGFRADLPDGSAGLEEQSLQDRPFVACAFLSNARIASVLKRLPAESSIAGACHGAVAVTDSVRTNASGALDGDYSVWGICEIL